MLSDQASRRYLHHLLLVLLLLVGLSLRLYGLNWDDNHHLHPDERQITMVVSRLGMPPLRQWPSFFTPPPFSNPSEENPNFFDAETSPLNPHFFAYGSLPFYLLRITTHLVTLPAGLSGQFASWPAAVDFLEGLRRMSDYDHITLVGRALSAIIDTGVICLTYLLGKRVYDRRVGLLGALFVTFTVFHIQLAHFYAVDTLLTFLVLLFFIFALDFAREGGLGNAMVMGATAGLALATKVSAAPLLLVVAGAYAIHSRREHVPFGRLTRLFLVTLAILAIAFFIAEPYALLDFEAFSAGIAEQGRMVRGIADYPYTRQYINTPAFVYQIKHTTLWGMGLPLGLVAYFGLGFFLWRVVRQRRGEELLLLAWVGPYFLITGLFMVKFIRYMLPLLPLFLILGAAMLFAFKDWLSRRFTAGRQLAATIWYGITGFVIASAVVYVWAFISIYSRPHSRIQASEWIYRNLPPGSTLALEHWDDDLPLSRMVDGQSRNIGEYLTLKMNLYEWDDGEKFQHIVSNLQQSDYVILSSNRLYGSIPRLPWRYPITSRYYELLFEERLGFRLLGTFTSYPSLLGFSINDDAADESFTVYDHPKVLIFGKNRQLSEGEYRELFSEALEVQPTLQPTGVSAQQSGKDLLLDRPVDELPVIDDRGWNPVANAHALLSVISWWLVLQVLGLLALPLTTLVFHRLKDRGYILSKTLGLLVVGFLVWLGASYRLVTNSLPTTLAACLFLGLGSWYVFWRRRSEMLALWRDRRRLILLSEGLLGAAFLFFVAIRVLNPDLWHPWNGGEKSMELAFLNAITRSPYFPPYDPYFAGGYVNYYYYGLHLVAILIKLTGIVPVVAFNLAVPSLFALTVVNGFSLGYNLTGDRLAGLLSSVFVALLGNLDGLVQLVEWLGQAGGLAFESRIPGVEGLVRAVPGVFRLLLGRGQLGVFDYWRSSRVIPQTINEFPYWSFLFADLHPHMIGIPVTLFLLAVALNLSLAGKGWSDNARSAVKCAQGEATGGGRADPGRRWHSLTSRFAATEMWSLDNGVGLLVLALALGAVAVINTWDLPAYLLVVLGALLLGVGGFWRWRPGLAAAGVLGLVACSGVVLYLPFFTHYEALYVGLGLVRIRTELEPFLTIWGLFLFVLGTLLWVEVVWGQPRKASLRCQGLLVRRGLRLPRLLDLHQALVRRPGMGYILGLLVLMATGFICGVLLILQLWVLAILVPPVVLYGMLVLRRHTGIEENFVALLAFLGFGILLGCEVVFLKDFLQGGEYHRMNTIFKFYTQAWVLLGVVAGTRLSTLWRWFSTVRRRWLRYGWRISLIVLLASSAVFLFLGTWQRVDDRFPGPRPPVGTLDGAAFMTVGSYTWPDENNRIQLVYDHQAIRWFEDTVTGTPVVAEAPLPYYREFGLKVASYTGLPTLLGAHQNEQRYDWQVGPRSEDANALYRTADLEETRELIARLNISYIYVGQLERSVYPEEGLEKFELLRQSGELTLAYENPGVRVYEAVDR